DAALRRAVERCVLAAAVALVIVLRGGRTQAESRGEYRGGADGAGHDATSCNLGAEAECRTVIAQALTTGGSDTACTALSHGQAKSSITRATSTRPCSTSWIGRTRELRAVQHASDARMHVP